MGSQDPVQSQRDRQHKGILHDYRDVVESPGWGSKNEECKQKCDSEDGHVGACVGAPSGYSYEPRGGTRCRFGSHWAVVNSYRSRIARFFFHGPTASPYRLAKDLAI